MLHALARVYVNRFQPCLHRIQHAEDSYNWCMHRWICMSWMGKTLPHSTCHKYWSASWRGQRKLELVFWGVFCHSKPTLPGSVCSALWKDRWLHWPWNSFHMWPRWPQGVPGQPCHSPHEDNKITHNAWVLRQNGLAIHGKCQHPVNKSFYLLSFRLFFPSG